ncbi:MAG TPA: hypothetical protein VL027_08355 [Spongiibacteraceae bacterium]|jgi:hypothetical protein|nr:hypothetical protein [Spongiibacteraceae bacterium]HUH37941.1 hypothetical protein [Spongiibacteraceae bacterium]
MKMFWNRRSGFERRLISDPPADEQRFLERRNPRSDGYVLVIGEGGLDRFSLMVMVPVLGLLCAALVSSWLATG